MRNVNRDRTLRKARERGRRRTVSTPNGPEPDELLSLQEAARWLGVTERTMRNWMTAGRFQPDHGDASLLIRRSVIEAWLDDQRVTPGRTPRSRLKNARAPEELITVAEAGRRLGIAPATFWRWLNLAELPFFELPSSRDRRRVRHVRATDVERVAAKRRNSNARRAVQP